MPAIRICTPYSCHTLHIIAAAEEVFSHFHDAIKTEDLLRRISMVFQDVYLFNDTILNNIKVGRSDATMVEVIAAAQKARCHEFIERLPGGYETMVGEGGYPIRRGETTHFHRQGNTERRADCPAR